MKTIVKIFLAAALTGAAAIPALAYEAALEFQTRVYGRRSQVPHGMKKGIHAPHVLAHWAQWPTSRLTQRRFSIEPCVTSELAAESRPSRAQDSGGTADLRCPFLQQVWMSNLI